ncbi:hypothetical protein K1719_027870 [Acacia pycnantha]|nr:hypothetical protein K1719_027870 [Acacia pycnantha]
MFPLLDWPISMNGEDDEREQWILVWWRKKIREREQTHREQIHSTDRVDGSNTDLGKSSRGGDNISQGGRKLSGERKVLIPSSPSSSFKNSISTLHQVPEGHVGVYWKGGALLKTITEPGFHVKMPFITQYGLVQVALQTNVVTDIPCGTKGGVQINFEKIQVVNRLHKEYVYGTLLNYGMHYDKTLIHDKIHHHMNQFCTSHSFQQVYIDDFVQIGEEMKEALQVDCTHYALGIEIIGVHVTKPSIPDSISRNLEQLEEERTKVLIVVERQKVAEKEAETSKKIAINKAEENANVSKILMVQTLLEKESSKRQQEIENQMYLQREKYRVDANFYRATKEAEAEANKLKLAEYLKLKYIEAIVEIAKRSSYLVKLLQYLQLFARYFFH